MGIRPTFVLGSSVLLVSGLVLTVAGPALSGPRKLAKAGAASPVRAETADFAKSVVPLLQKYCVACHSGANAMGGIDLKAYRDEAAVLKARGAWERIGSNISSGHMPPKSAAQPTPAQRKLLTTWIEVKLSTADCRLKDPGRVTMRRLNRAEYNNTIRDLLGVNFRPADDFPSDDVGYGFDNIGDVLTISPILMEKYLGAAEKIAEAAIVVDDPMGRSRRFEAENLPATGGQGVVQGNTRNLVSDGEVNVSLEFPQDGEYLLRARVFGQQAGTEPAKMAFRLDGKELERVDVPEVESAPKVYEKRLQVTQGKHLCAVAFMNDFYDPKAADPKNRDRNLVVDYLEVVGPIGVKTRDLPETHKRLLVATPGPNATPEETRECARKILAPFARRAYRRPVTPAEVDRLVRYVDLAAKEKEPFERGIQLAVEAALVSPNFLFRVETNVTKDEGGRMKDEKGANPLHPSSLILHPSAARPLNDWELASRLSYFLWSTMPDEELFTLAGKAQLRNPKVLEAQARRMLKDPKARALVENFAGQWLQLRNLKNVSPDPGRFPGFNEALRGAMQKETELFFECVMTEDRSVLDFIDARYTFLNERLAKHYGIEGVQGDQFRKVALQGDQRGGILSQASILTITSNPTRTSPVKRGKWVLEQILGTPPPPPPPNVPELKEDKNMMLTGTLRQRMEQHRTDPGCASCHARMDPIGFGLENYDAIGAWRATEGSSPIDSSGTLPDGKSFNGPAQLRQIFMAQKDQFARNLTEQLLTYALGRGLEYYDKCAVRQMSGDVAKRNYRFSALVTSIVTSDPFRMRKSQGTNDDE